MTISSSYIGLDNKRIIEETISHLTQFQKIEDN